MKFKLKKLQIKNFKSFKDITLDIHSQTLTLLDGPNGFGKTSFYDALELLLTGEVARYKLFEKVIDGRTQVFGSPLLHDGAADGECLSIRGEVETPGGTLFIERKAEKSALDAIKGIGESVLHLYKLNSLKDDEDINPIEDEQLFLTAYLGNNYKRNFQLFHYIEQEDNTAMLKSPERSKQEKIDHLFDVDDHRDKIDRIDGIRKVVAKLKAAQPKKVLKVLKDELERLQKESLPEQGATEYKRLITATEQPWDKEVIELGAGTIAGWLGDEGVLARIKALKENAGHYFNALHNDKLTKNLTAAKDDIESLLLFGQRIEFIAQYKTDLKRFDFAAEYLQRVDAGLIEAIGNDQLAVAPLLTELLAELLPDDFSIDGYAKSLGKLKALIQSSGTLQLSMTKLRDARKGYIEHFNNHQAQQHEPTSQCPTCGYDWQSSDELLTQIQQQEALINSAIAAGESTLQVQIKTFKTDFLDLVVGRIEQYIETETPLNDYKKSICELDESTIHRLKTLKENYAAFKADLTPYFCETFDLHESLKVDALAVYVTSLQKPVDHALLAKDFDEHFQQLFDSNQAAVNSLTLEDLAAKHAYLQWCYVKAKTVEIADKEKAYKQAKLTVDNATKLAKQLKTLVDLYNANLNQYIATTARDIEVLFHIYSGRLLQNFQNGLGVFIESDGKSISFRENPQKKHDVIFSMSSGQLSALVIAFTLALNNRYAKNELLLIDDPVQTLDEINVAGFIDLLRHEFADRQIFLSTHEDNMSSYMRYKFKKMALQTQRINFKNEMT